jgi:sulfonate transport system substrate-binding protein
MEVVMTLVSRRWLFAGALTLTLLPAARPCAADNPKEIFVDWATYNPVSMLLKDKGFLEKEFAKDGIKVVWVKTVSSSNALQFLNAGSINFGSTAGSAALVARINGNPIKSVACFFQFISA